MTPELINIWDSEIQKLVNSNYKKYPRWPFPKDACNAQADIAPSTSRAQINLGTTILESPITTHTDEAQKKPRRYRADVKWKWKDLFWRHSINNYLGERTTLIGKSHAVCMILRKNGRTFPIGMLIVVPKFLSVISGDRSSRAFSWYLADAPTEFYNAIKSPKIENVADALLDYSIQAGHLENGYRSLLLHASPKGGDRLKKFYRSDCGMASVPVAVTAVSKARFLLSRKDYFFFDDKSATEFCSQYDVYRQPSPARLPAQQSAYQGA
ncbi:hypothetical protein [Pseudomonas viridiflava]|nr:hypothetical protein [Pseudomonas viridiflava]